MYIDPSKVVSPKASVSAVRVLEDKGENSFSISRLRYNQREELACRWNGSDEDPSGHPNSRGIATWFLIPNEMRNDVLDGVLRRAKEEQPHIYFEWEEIKKELSATEVKGTEITIYPLKHITTTKEANLLIEIIKKEKETTGLQLDLFDIDGEGNRTNSPVSQISGKLHITLLREED